MEIEKNTEHFATAAVPESAQSETKTSESTQTTSSETTSIEQPVEGRLTPEILAKKAANYTKKAAKSAVNAEDKKESKNEEKTQVEAKTETNDAKTEEKVEKYTPNPKFVALAKEYDLPKWAQEAIKDPDSEKEIKTVFSKAWAADHFMGKNQELTKSNQEVTQNYNELYGGVNELRTIYQESLNSGNLIGLDDFFGRLKIPFNVILNYAQQKIQFEELPPEQKQMLVGSLEAQRRARELETKNQEFQTNASQATAQTRALQLQSSLTRPEVAPIVQAFDSAPGRQPGSFWNAVKEHGEFMWFKSGGKVDLSPEEAVQQVIAKFGLSNASVNQPQAQAPAMQQQAATTVAPQAVAPHRSVPVIPSVTSRATSPVGQKFKSVEDIKKYTKEKYANG